MALFMMEGYSREGLNNLVEVSGFDLEALNHHGTLSLSVPDLQMLTLGTHSETGEYAEGSHRDSSTTQKSIGGLMGRPLLNQLWLVHQEIATVGAGNEDVGTVSLPEGRVVCAGSGRRQELQGTESSVARGEKEEGG